MENIVRFQFTKFIGLDVTGVEKEQQYGYRIFDEYANYCNDTFTWEQLTGITPQDVLEIIEADYDELYESVLDKGFYFNEQWIDVDETGTIIS